MISLEDILDTVDHSREKRKYFANLMVKNPSLLPELLDICGRIDEDIS